jgi:hypothetical protein
MKTSYSDLTCIKEIKKFLHIDKSVLYLSVLYNVWKDDPESVIDINLLSEYQYCILNFDYEYDFTESYGWYTYILSDYGKYFIQLVKNRKKTRFNLNKGYDLFPETANLLI